MKALLVLLSTLLISASRLTDAAAIVDAQKADSAIGVPPLHPNVLLQKPSQFTDTRNAAEQQAAQAAGKKVGEEVGQAVGDQLSKGINAVGNEVGDLLGGLFGGGFLVLPLPANSLNQQQPPAVHPHVLFQRPSAWTDFRDGVEKGALGALGGVLGGLFGR